MARRKPRLVITVTTTVSSRKRAAGVQVAGADGDDVVAVDDGAGVVDGDQPVGVAVEGQPGVGPFGHDREPEVLRMGGAAAIVDVAAIGVVVDDDDVGAEALERGRRHLAGGAVGAVEHEGEAVEAVAGQDAGEVLDVALAGAAAVGRPSPTSSPGGPPAAPASTASSSASTASSTSSGSLRPPGANSLMPLSANGLCEAEIMAPGTPSASETKATAGRGQHAEALHGDALGGEAGGQRRLEEGAGDAGVAADHDPLAAEHPRRGAAEGERQLGRELGVGDAADAVGAEAQRHARAPSISASSTAGPCGPSSGRTSCSPSPGRHG